MAATALLLSACGSADQSTTEVVASQPIQSEDPAVEPETIDAPASENAEQEDVGALFVAAIDDFLSDIGPNLNDPSTPEGAVCYLFDEVIAVTFIDVFSNTDWKAAIDRGPDGSRDISDDDPGAGISPDAVASLASVADELRPVLSRLEDPDLAAFARGMLDDIDQLRASPTPGFVESFDELDERTEAAVSVLFEQGICVNRSFPDVQQYILAALAGTTTGDQIREMFDAVAAETAPD